MTHNTYGGHMKAADLEIGQTLIEVTHGRWSNPIHTERSWIVTKKLKTRLIVTMLREVKGVLVPTAIHERVIVRDGRVTTSVEGKSSRYDGMSLYTEDDPHLPEVRLQTERSEYFLQARIAAETAHKNLEPKTARAAVEALQAYLDSNPED